MNDEEYLTDEQELVGDEIATSFYSENSQSLSEVIDHILSGRPTYEKDLITEATLNRLFSEQAARREYLSKALAIAGLNQAEVDIKILELASSPQPSLPPDVAQQLQYYKVVGANLQRYQIELWQKENTLIYSLLLQLPEEKITALATSVNAFIVEFYKNDFEKVEQLTVPPNIRKIIDECGLGPRFDKYETVLGQAAFLVFVSAVSQTILQARERGVTDQDQVAFAASQVTFRLKNALTVVE